MSNLNFGLIGFPLGHSFSKAYFEEKFRTLNCSGFTYQNFEVANRDDIPMVLRQDVFGFNVTRPYKSDIIDFLNEIDRTAHEVGAVNTLVRTGKNSWKGFNTDVAAFRDSLLEWIGETSWSGKALVLGAGGAAKAVHCALREMGISSFGVSRQPGYAYTFDSLNADIIRDHLLIINATPVGTAPEILQAPPIPYENITSEHRLFDLVYNPSNTLFLTRGQQMGARIKNGLDMLHRQADHAWVIWKTYGNF